MHLHVLALDGVYTEEDGGRLTFHALPTPRATEVAEIAERTAKRLHGAFRNEGRASPWDEAGATDELTIAVGTALARWLGLPPAQIRASGTTALGSYLGFWRQIAAQATGE